MVDPNFQHVAHNLGMCQSNIAASGAYILALRGHICIDQHLCRWASISAIPMNNTYIKSWNIILDIFLGHYSTRACTSVFHTDFAVIQHALALHDIAHQNMSLVQCCRALIPYYYWDLLR
jgi:hypothetical protein